VNQLKLLIEINTLQQLNPFSKSTNHNTSFSSMLDSFVFSQNLNSNNRETHSNSTQTLNTSHHTSDVKAPSTGPLTNVKTIPVKIADEQLRPIIEEAAEKYHLPQNLITAVIKHESNFNMNAVSSAGARGLMQLMPDTARGLGVKDIHDPRENIMAGTKYLRQMLDRFGTVELALAAYNAGPGNVNKFGGIPPFKETQTYVEQIMNELHKNV
jgi:soluble lytic murein transglycosylase-like protein